ncbi:hypothetical protein [uncultured Microbulbifer sp.]|uniref:hypothetical protein n=1 Tax=uncultured Microbulbifer sp. TaxID=348147 RepID=UPI00261DF722|nr:hypothetical protein [uncultured Microbulbifer sp.]
MKKTTVAAVVAAMALPLGGQVLAQDTGFFSDTYLRASVAQVDYDVDFVDVGVDLVLGKTTGFTLVGGYQHSPFVSFELGYYNLGEVSDSIPVSYSYGDAMVGFEIEGESTFKVETSGSTFGASVRLHTDNGKPFYGGALVGYQRWNLEYRNKIVDNYRLNTYDLVGNSVGVESGTLINRFKESRSGNDPFYGLFVAWVTPVGEFGLEYTVFEVDGEKPKLLGASYAYRF